MRGWCKSDMNSILTDVYKFKQVIVRVIHLQQQVFVCVTCLPCSEFAAEHLCTLGQTALLLPLSVLVSDQVGG